MSDIDGAAAAETAAAINDAGGVAHPYVVDVADAELARLGAVPRTAELRRVVIPEPGVTGDVVLAIGAGTLDPTMAVMTGKLKLSDMGTAMALQPKMGALFAKMR